jgi:antitoxin YefM
MPIETSFSELEGNLNEYLDRVVDDAEVLYVRRPNGKNIAMISADQMSSFLETRYLLASPANAERLRTALRSARQGRGRQMTVDELRAEVGLDSKE